MGRSTGARSNGARSNSADVAAEAKRVADAASRDLTELARRAERILHGRAQRLKSQSREAATAADAQLETARTYVVERVQERPFTTTLAVLGAGFLLGLLVAGRRR